MVKEQYVLLSLEHDRHVLLPLEHDRRVLLSLEQDQGGNAELAAEIISICGEFLKITADFLKLYDINFFGSFRYR